MSNELQTTKVFNVIPPTAIKDNAAFVSNVIDKASLDGADYLEFIVNLGATDIAMAQLRVMESDTLTSLADQSAKTGQAVDEHGRQVDRAKDSQESFTGAIRGSIQSWVAWGTVIGAAVAGIKEVIQTATDAAKAVAELGNQLNALSVNQGGGTADQTLQDINAIARLQNLSIEGRNELIGAAGTITDDTPDISRSDLQAQLTNIARLRRVAGDAAGSGGDAASLLMTAQARGGLAPDAAADQVAALLTSGFDQQTLGEMYRRGDQDYIAAVYAARGQGLDLGRSASAIPQIANALNRRDAQGNLTPELQAAGITADMSTVARLQAIAATAAQGTITQDQLLGLTGGFESQDVVGPLLRAVSPQNLAQARQEIASTTLADLEARRGESRYVQAADRAAARELREQMAREESSLAGAGDGVLSLQSQRRAQGHGNALIGASILGNHGRARPTSHTGGETSTGQ